MSHEKHFTGNETVKDIVIGMSDGLTVPFALAAGLSGVVGSTALVVTAGLAEIAAGSIAMGLGGYLAAKGEIEHYDNEELREYYEVEQFPQKERDEVLEVFEKYGVERSAAQPIVDALEKNPKAWVDFMMRFELGLERPESKRAYVSAATICASYIVGGLIPLVPYMAFNDTFYALSGSVGLTLVALFVFGMIKARFVGLKPWKSGLETVLIGGAAASIAYLIAKLFS